MYLIFMPLLSPFTQNRSLVSVFGFVFIGTVFFQSPGLLFCRMSCRLISSDGVLIIRFRLNVLGLNVKYLMPCPSPCVRVESHDVSFSHDPDADRGLDWAGKFPLVINK